MESAETVKRALEAPVNQQLLLPSFYTNQGGFNKFTVLWTMKKTVHELKLLQFYFCEFLRYHQKNKKKMKV